MLRDLKERISQARVQRRAETRERALKRKEVDDRRREHKLRHGGSGGEGGVGGGFSGGGGG